MILSAAALSAAIAVAVMHRGASAQVANPQVLLNWQASTYVPKGFDGKILPTSDSVITAGVDLFDQGRHVDLSGQRISWYLDDNFYKSGTGLTRITFSAPHFIGTRTMQLRVSIPDYGDGPARAISVPIVSPEVVIQSSSPTLSAATTPFNLQAFPYFFSVQNPSELNFQWTVNNDPAVMNQNPFVVTRAMANEGTPGRLQLRVNNPVRPIEIVNTNLTLFPNP